MLAQKRVAKYLQIRNKFSLELVLEYKLNNNESVLEFTPNFTNYRTFASFRFEQENGFYRRTVCRVEELFLDYDILVSETVPLDWETLIFRTVSVASILLEYGGSGILAD
jgi:hypothetical protein